MYLSKRKYFQAGAVIALVLCLALVIVYKRTSLFSKADTLTPGGITFSDVPETHWAYDSIEAAALAGVVQGYSDGTFKPTLEVTKDQLAVMIARALAGGDAKVPAGPAAATFVDVPLSHWAFKYIEYCKTKNIVAVPADRLFKPTTVMTRDATSVFIAKAVAGGDAKVPAATGQSYTDVLTTHWAYKYIEYLTSEGLASGYDDGKFHPEYKVTRDQAAVFIARAFSLIATYWAPRIHGRITDSVGKPIANAFLQIDTDIIAKTDANGNYPLINGKLEALDVELGEHEFDVITSTGVTYGYANNAGNFIEAVHGNQIQNLSGLVPIAE